MSDHCFTCRGAGRIHEDPISDYSPTAPGTWHLCRCHLPNAREPPRRSADDEMAAFIAASGIEYPERTFDA